MNDNHSRVKRAVDRDRRPGRFFLTGSANLLLMRRVSESLAGRASYLTLWPMTRREQRGLGRAGLWDELLAADDGHWLDVLRAPAEMPEDWRPLARRGGYPVPSVHLTTDDARSTWFAGFTRTYLERDLQELSAIGSLPDFRRVMRAVCLRLGQLVNQTELARDVGVPQPTARPCCCTQARSWNGSLRGSWLRRGGECCDGAGARVRLYLAYRAVTRYTANVPSQCPPS